LLRPYSSTEGGAGVTNLRCPIYLPCYQSMTRGEEKKTSVSVTTLSKQAEMQLLVVFFKTVRGQSALLQINMFIVIYSFQTQIHFLM
jgi:hypothetical protein